MLRNAPSLTVALSIAALTLSGCVTPQANAPAATDDSVAEDSAWFARGTEPFWNVEITPATIRFNRLEGRPVTVANPGARPSFNGERYVTRAITIDVTHVACSDGMSDRRYADTVMVEVGGETLRGCGGRVLPPTHLDGTSWRITSVDGAPPIAGDRALQMQFSGNRVSAYVGCNQLSGAFTSDGTRLTISRMASTRMACPQPLMAQEARFMALFGQSLAMRVDGRGRMILTGNDNATIVLEQII